MTREELYDKAKRDYPEGTVYIPMNDKGVDWEKSDYFSPIKSNRMTPLHDGGCIWMGLGYVYSPVNQRWATILEPVYTEEYILI